ncbi:efflux RND transporter periplasmic adaptor subunit [Rhodohalobacter sp. 8-1]|uniref:efflux RND transporter periplasmic adaptor subunit n=1 Tax=Rhodohalobacter sp. 8-1 TaxID=3131972 RepID=UPI0030EC90F6
MNLAKTVSLLLLLVTLALGCSDREQVIVERKNLVQGVYASGNVMPTGYYEVTSKVPGIIDKILVSVGENVEIGTPLAKLQNQPNEANLQIARNQLELARKHAAPDSDVLAQLEKQVENARAVFVQDSTEFERRHRLRDDNIGSRQTLDLAELRYKTSLKSYQIARRKLSETRSRLEVELDNARNNFIAQQSRTGDYTLLSAIEGKVYDIMPKEGELVAGSRPIMEIGSANEFETELQVDETDIVMVKAGQTVHFELDALEDTVLSGSVSLIYPRIDTIERTAKVIASINPGKSPLYPGMALEANIIVREKEDILVIPVTYINDENEVILANENRKQIETGIRDLNYVEVVSGLSEGDVILKPGP